MSKFTKLIIDEIDHMIKTEEFGVDIFCFPVNPTEIDGKVEPLYCTYDEERGTNYILKIISENKKITYLRLYASDGGVIVSRSDETENLDSLMFKSSEGWTKL